VTPHLRPDARVGQTAAARRTGSGRVIAMLGDPLPCLSALLRAGGPAARASASDAPDLLVLGVDARRVRTRAGFAALLRRRRRTVLAVPDTVAHIIVVVDHVGPPEPWMEAVAHRWAFSIHRRLELSRGVDTAVTALLADPGTSPDLVAERVAELARRPPGVNPAAVLCAGDIRSQTIAQASASDFI